MKSICFTCLHLFYLLLFALLAACSPSETGSTGSTMSPAATFQLTSDAFEEGGSIPQRYSCRGEDISPALAWSGHPAETASFVLSVTDPDARGFVHWAVWNIPGDANSISEGALPSGAVEGMNNFRRIGWAGPCPPSGNHRYVFTLYALDSTIDLPEGATLNDLQDAMNGHVLAQATLTGVFP